MAQYKDNGNGNESNSLELLNKIEKNNSSITDYLESKVLFLKKEITEAERFCSDLSKESKEEIHKLKHQLNDKNNLISEEWLNLLRYQQEDFIKRINNGISSLLSSNVEGLHTELVKISKDKTKKMKEFCWEIADKYKLNQRRKVKELFINNLKGKLAEESIRQYLGNIVGDVNYEINVEGDGFVPK
jgi:hypothetical protein